MTITDTDHDHASPDHVSPVEATSVEATPADPCTVEEHDADTPETTGTGPVTDTEGPVGELLRVDPRDLIIGANVRRDIQLDRAFRRSVADRGVREPIIVRRREDGALVVVKGKRRTVAAIEGNRATVPVLVEPGAPAQAADRAGQIERIVDQLEENLHRAANTDLEEVLAHQELLDLGLSAGQIARRTHSGTKRVKVTTQVARSEVASAVLARYDLTLDQAAVIAEFDDTAEDGTATEDSADAVKLLTVAAQKDPGQFPHVAQRLRDAREDTRLVTERTAELTAAGVPIIDTATVTGAAQITGLRPTATDPSGAELTDAAHTACPGHAAQVEIRRGWNRETHLRTIYWCTDPAGNGHVVRWNTAAATGAGAGSGPRQLGPLDDAERAQRRRVIANNKDWDSATTVRRDWLRGFLARKTAPRNAPQFIAATLGRAGHYLRKAMESGHPTACELLGMTPTGSVYGGRRSPIAVAAETAGTPRATVLTLAVLLGAAEDATSRDTWRNPTSDDRAYFTVLTEWGYPLSEVEQLVLNPDGPTATVPGDTAHEAAADDTATGEPEPVTEQVLNTAELQTAELHSTGLQSDAVDADQVPDLTQGADAA